MSLKRSIAEVFLGAPAGCVGVLICLYAFDAEITLDGEPVDIAGRILIFVIGAMTFLAGVMFRLHREPSRATPTTPQGERGD